MTNPAGAYSRPVSQEARCVVHPFSQATGTCTRCGSYVCADCNVGADGMCAACRERLGIDQFPFTRDAWEIGGLVSHAWEAFTRNWGPLVGLALAIFLLPMLTSAIGALAGALVPAKAVRGVLAIVSELVQLSISLALTLGAIGVFLDAVRGRPLSFGSFMNGLRRLGAGLLQYLAIFGVLAALIGIPVAIGTAAHLGQGMWVAALIGLAVLLIPGIYVGLGLAFMQFELVNDPDCGAIEAFRRSWEIARGKRVDIFGAGVVAGLVMLAGMIMCGIGALASYPIGMMVTTGLYLALRNGSELPQPASRS